jgi:hypothetical protein
METPAAPIARVSSGDWLFWLKWVAASTAAILLGVGLLFAAIFLARAIDPGVNEDKFMGVIMIPVLAALLGVFQWLVLRRRIPKSGWWIPATLAGLLGGIALVGGLMKAMVHFTGREWNWDTIPGQLLVGGVIGFLLALVQLPILWRRIPGFALWPLASTLGWFALCLIIGKSIDRTSDILALGAVPALFTGLCLIWPIRIRPSAPAQTA